MAITIRAGQASVKIGSELQRRLDTIVRATNGQVLDEIEHIVSTIQQQAAEKWYTQVEYRDGSTGDIDWEVRVTPDQVRGRIVSSDRAAYMVRRPGPTSLINVPRGAGEGNGERFKGTVAPSVYSEIMSQFRRTGQLPAGTTEYTRRDGRPTNLRRYQLNPKRSDGRNLWQELVNKPLRKYVNVRAPQLAQAITRAARRA